MARRAALSQRALELAVEQRVRCAHHSVHHSDVAFALAFAFAFKVHPQSVPRLSSEYAAFFFDSSIHMNMNMNMTIHTMAWHLHLNHYIYICIYICICSCIWIFICICTSSTFIPRVEQRERCAAVARHRLLLSNPTSLFCLNARARDESALPPEMIWRLLRDEGSKVTPLTLAHRSGSSRAAASRASRRRASTRTGRTASRSRARTCDVMQFGI